MEPRVFLMSPTNSIVTVQEISVAEFELKLRLVGYLDCQVVFLSFFQTETDKLLKMTLYMEMSAKCVRTEF